MQSFTKVGLDGLLTPENCVLLLIDHQPSQLANVNSHEPAMVINNATALAKTAKAYGVPTILATINTKRGVEIFQAVPGSLSRSEAHRHCCTLVGDVSCTARYPRDGRRL
ncbi:MAG TPA: hypothetical protein VK752_29385 [Bryobacteraceae bacterium]|nr:hypothetical protein [Bryobacteraceae bacterium]